MKLSILGTEYEVIFQKLEDNDKLLGADGLCETYTKKLIVNDFVPDKTHVDNIDEYKKKVLRHEIMHAFLHESGLSHESEWATNEEMIDWFALQSPKILDILKQANCI